MSVEGHQPRRDDLRAWSGQRWATDPEARRRSGVVGGVGRCSPGVRQIAAVDPSRSLSFAFGTALLAPKRRCWRARDPSEWGGEPTFTGTRLGGTVAPMIGLEP